jgi:hypothetical protein
MKAFYKPWIGSEYRAGGLLVLSESAYGTPEDGWSPKPNHPSENTVRYWVYKRFEDRGREAPYMAAITRALCLEKYPGLAERKLAWEKIAYSIYVQRPLKDVHQRPTSEDFTESGKPFLELLEDLRPRRVVMTGYQMWSHMPDTQIQIHDYKQAYRLKDGTLVWCLAVPHVQSRKEGHRFRWEDIGQRIRDFVAEALPMQ